MRVSFLGHTVVRNSFHSCKYMKLLLSNVMCFLGNMTTCNDQVNLVQTCRHLCLCLTSIFISLLLAISYHLCVRVCVCYLLVVVLLF